MKSFLLSLFLAFAVVGYSADLTITASAVVPSSSAVFKYGTAGATIAAGQLCYLDTADLDGNGIGKVKLSDANGAAALRVIDGIAISSASAGQPVGLVTYDPALVIAASGLTANQILLSSATAGGVAPSADLTTGWYLTVIGVVKSGTTIFFRAPGHVSGAAS